MTTKTQFKKAAEELKAEGWSHIFSVMAAGAGLAYGMCFTKDGVKFYLNKDTCMPNFTGPQMAQACAPIFN